MTAATSREPVDIGWILCSGQAHFLYGAPTPVERPGLAPLDPDPFAIEGREPQYFQFPVPYDLRLRLVRDREGILRVVNVHPGTNTLDARFASQVAVLVDEPMWRAPDRPVVQIATPYRMVTDDEVWATQMAPIWHYQAEARPGPQVTGRFPLYLWPRMMSWAVEWVHTDEDLVLKAGEPWFYVKFEPEDMTRPVRMVGAVMTDELAHYCRGLDQVVHYMNNTYSLFSVARRRRPRKLLATAPWEDARHG